MNEGWSEATRQRTLEALYEKAMVPMRDWVPMKRFHAVGGSDHGRIALDDWWSSWPMTVTDGAGATETFEDCDALLAAGWAVD